MGWLDGWISFTSPFDKRSTYARYLLPPTLAREFVEGGASYLDCTGTPLPTALANMALAQARARASQNPPASPDHS